MNYELIFEEYECIFDEKKIQTKSASCCFPKDSLFKNISVSKLQTFWPHEQSETLTENPAMARLRGIRRGWGQLSPKIYSSTWIMLKRRGPVPKDTLYE